MILIYNDVHSEDSRHRLEKKIQYSILDPFDY